MKEKKFQTRSFISLLTFFGFIVMSVTGIILYVTPQGRIAYWTDWKFLGLTKVDWGNIHILSCFLFLIVGSFHLYYNWKPLTHYLTEKASKGLKLKRELVISFLIILFIIVGAIYQIEPLKSVITLNDFIKETWIVSREYEPPFGHAEELSLKTFTKKMKIDFDKALIELKKKGIKVENEKDSLQKIARMNHTSPMYLYVIIKKFEQKPEIVKKDSYTAEMIEEQFSGTGLGRKLFSEVCQEVGVDISESKEKLKRKGIVVKEDETFRKIAERYKMNPIDILKILLVKSS